MPRAELASPFRVANVPHDSLHTEPAELVVRRLDVERPYAVAVHREPACEVYAEEAAPAGNRPCRHECG